MARSAAPAASSRSVRVPAQRAAALGDRGGVLAVERAAQACADSARHAGFLQQGGHQRRQGQVEGDAGEADGGERLGADLDDLGVRLGAVMADQFDAGLGDLALGGEAARRARAGTARRRRAAAGAASGRDGWWRCGRPAG